MSKGIELSPKYGLNPCMPICFWCGKEKGEIALMGRIRVKDPITGKAIRGSDAEAPRSCVLDYEPCSECQEKFHMGVVLVEVRRDTAERNPIQLPIQEGLYPTGRWCVIKTDAAQEIFEGEYHEGNIVLLEPDVYCHFVQEE